MGTLYPVARADEWVEPVYRGYRVMCCDCGLVHTIDFRIRKGAIQFRARRNNRATAQLRRHRRLPCQESTDG